MSEIVYIVSNREIDESKEPKLKFGLSQNPKGIDEIRLGKATRSSDNNIEVSIIEEAGWTPGSENQDPPSYKLFKDLNSIMRTKKRNCVFLVHGYNTNFEAALNTAFNVRKYYGVEVILFSWPSLGGGEGRDSIGKDVIGTASYKRDKRIAMRSVGALDRCFEKLNLYMNRLTEGEDCKQKFTLLCHSMGNYLLKNLLKSSVYEGETLIFDNVVLCQADINSKDHDKYIDKIAHRRRMYVTINENDFALAWSRRKLGKAQKARLGHFTRNLTSTIAVYLDFTNASWVKKSHSFFSDEVPEKNKRVHSVFNDILNGERGERSLNRYDPNQNVFQID